MSSRRRPDVLMGHRGSRLSAQPSLEHHPCGCGGTGWAFVTDAFTGTVYTRCTGCGRHVPASPRGWLDWSVGVCVESSQVIGSAWTQQVSPTFLDASKLTHAS